MAWTAFDDSERRMRAGRPEAYAASFVRHCAYAVPTLLDAVDARPGTRLLDVGTGTGSVAGAAHARGADVIALDADSGMLGLARRAMPATRLCHAALPDLPFPDSAFDAVAGNFVLNHVGRPGAALAEIRRVTRPAGRIAVTIWAAPRAPGQALLGRAVQAAGVSRPPWMPKLAPEDEFPRTEQGFADLLRAAGLTQVRCDTLSWEHRVTAQDWWSGQATGFGAVGQIVVSQPPETVAEIRRHYDKLCAEFAAPDGDLRLPHAALVASGRA